MLHHVFPARRALVATAALALTLAACGGGDDEGDAAASATTEAGSTTTTATTEPAGTEAPAASESTAPATTAAAEDGSATAAEGDETSDDTIIVQSLDEMPQECQDLFVDFLKLVEPSVGAVDWETATIGDFTAISDDLADEFASMDEQVAANGCDAYDFAEDADSITPMIELAEQEAPGTVGWLEFLATLDDEPVVNADLPTDCDGALAYIDGLVTEGRTMNDIPFSDVADVSQLLNVISSECDPAVVSEFFARPEITDFLG